MNTREPLVESVGAWSGTYRLWLSPDDPGRVTETGASVELVARATFGLVRYDWAYDGEPQDGVLLVRLAPDQSAVAMVWVDSWHTGGGFMEFRGEGATDGTLTALGSYAAPGGPDWGWRIVVAADADTGLRITMFNITPDGQEMLAVESAYRRVDAAR